jgi:hypothetical protein
MGTTSKRLANQIVAGASVFLVVVGILNYTGACDPLIESAVKSAIPKKTPEDWRNQARRRAAEARAATEVLREEERRSILVEQEENEPRALGAWYPDDQVQEDPGLLVSLDPALLAVLGGGLVFALVAGVAFTVFGGGGREPRDQSSSSSTRASGPDSAGPM